MKTRKLSSRIPLIGVFAMALGPAIAALPFTAQAQRVSTDEDVARIIGIERLAVQNGEVSGELRNRANHPVRDVQLFIRYTWMWADERNPGKTDPGTSTYYTLKETIQPGAKINFNYKPSPPLPNIAGGRFVATVKIAGFTEIIPQK